MEFLYPAGATDWKVKITKNNSLIVTDTQTLDKIFETRYECQEKCLEVWEHLKQAWENGRCQWDDSLKRLVWRSLLNRT